MDVTEYWKDVVRQMKRQSDAIRRDFAQHRPSAGDNREDSVEKFLKQHLPKRFGISTGFVFSHNGGLSNQADLLIVDDQNNSPFYPDDRNQIWPVEAVYALIEVKTNLDRPEMEKAIAKGRRFKQLSRNFLVTRQSTHTADSLFVIWSFESPQASTVKQNLIELLKGIPRAEQPDLIIVPGCLVAQAGSFHELSRLGQPNSPYRKQLQSKHDGRLLTFNEQPSVYELESNSLMAWYVWFDSWLRQAGPRFTDPVKYLPSDQIFGREI